MDQFDQLESQRPKVVTTAIEEAVLHEDSRAHFIYSDKSALIMHPNGDCFTYFSADGRKTR
jgi:hypothetical protein